MKQKRRWARNDIVQLRSYAARGFSIREAAILLGRATWSAASKAAALGIHFHAKSGAPAGNTNRGSTKFSDTHQPPGRNKTCGPAANAAFYTQEQRDRALELLDRGTVVAKIAETIGCDPRTIYRWNQHRNSRLAERPEESAGCVPELNQAGNLPSGLAVISGGFRGGITASQSNVRGRHS